MPWISHIFIAFMIFTCISNPYTDVKKKWRGKKLTIIDIENRRRATRFHRASSSQVNKVK